MITWDFFVLPLFSSSSAALTSLEGVETWAVKHLLLDLAAVRAPRHQEDLRLEGGLRPVGVELIIIVIDAVTTVVSVPVLLVQVVQKVLVAVVPVSNLWGKDQHYIITHNRRLTVSTSIIPPWMTKVAYRCFLLFWISCVNIEVTSETICCEAWQSRAWVPSENLGLSLFLCAWIIHQQLSSTHYNSRQKSWIFSCTW